MKYYETDLTGLKNQADLHDRLVVELVYRKTTGEI